VALVRERTIPLVQKYFENLEVWCASGVEKISWTDLVRNGEALHTAKEEKNYLHTIKQKTNRICHTLLWNCHSINVIEGKVEGRI